MALLFQPKYNGVAADRKDQYYYFQVLSQHLYLLYLTIHTAFSMIFYGLDVKILTIINIISVLIYLAALQLNFRNRLRFAWLLINVQCIAYATLCTILIGSPAARSMLIFLPMLYFLFPVSFVRRLSYLGLISIVYIGLSYYEVTHLPRFFLEKEFMTSLDISSNALIMFILAYMTFYTYVAVIRNENELKNKHQQLQEEYYTIEKLSITDALTKLINRGKLEQTLSYEMERASRYNSIFSVILLDIDHFKSINDTFGHAAGDQVLMGIAKLLSITIRKADIVGRWGGEEFLIICPETDAKNAAFLAEKLRNALAKHSFPSLPQVTASFGVSGYHSGIINKDELIQNADIALYKAKKDGRNLVWTNALKP